jgi:hypothetical protein
MPVAVEVTDGNHVGLDGLEVEVPLTSTAGDLGEGRAG